MDLGDRVKIKPESLKRFGKDFQTLNPTGVIVRKLAPNNNDPYPPTLIYLINWDPSTDTASTSRISESSSYVLSTHLDFVEKPTLEWLITHKNPQIRNIGIQKQN